MNYELVKKLKEAGFADEMFWLGSRNPEEPLPFPTLSELIEACGIRFAGLLNGHDGGWRAFENFILLSKPPLYSMHDFIKGKSTFGSTPEEAVANLWLALNSKS